MDIIAPHLIVLTKRVPYNSEIFGWTMDEQLNLDSKKGWQIVRYCTLLSAYTPWVAIVLYARDEE